MTAKVKFQIKKTFSVKLLPFPHFVYRSWYWLTLTAGDEVHKNGIGPDTQYQHWCIPNENFEIKCLSQRLFVH